MKYTYKYKHTEKDTFKEVSYDYDKPPHNDELLLNEYELDPDYERIRNDHAWELVDAKPDLDRSSSESGLSLDEVIRQRRILQLIKK